MTSNVVKIDKSVDRLFVKRGSSFRGDISRFRVNPGKSFFRYHRVYESHLIIRQKCRKLREKRIQRTRLHFNNAAFIFYVGNIPLMRYLLMRSVGIKIILQNLMDSFLFKSADATDGVGQFVVLVTDVKESRFIYNGIRSCGLRHFVILTVTKEEARRTALTREFRRSQVYRGKRKASRRDTDRENAL